MKLKSQSWILLLGLALIVAFAAGIRQGSSVEKENVRRQNEILKLTPSPEPSFKYHIIKNERCGVTYLLPDHIASESSKVDIVCDDVEGTRSSSLVHDGYTGIPVNGNEQTIWVKVPQNLLELVTRSLRKIIP
jgi:hypothetical protein